MKKTNNTTKAKSSRKTGVTKSTKTNNTPKKLTIKDAPRNTTGRNSITIYVPVSHHVYYDGTSYRVRVTRGGERTSKNFGSKRKALEFRKTLL